MGCVSSGFINEDDDFPQIGSTKLNHHIVSLTSTTYGLLSLDPPPPPPGPPPTSSSPMTPPTPLPRFTLTPKTDSPSEPDVINSWELMAGLDSSTPDSKSKDSSFRFSPHSLPPSNSKPSTPKFFTSKLKENFNPNTRVRKPLHCLQLFPDPKCRGYKLEQFDKLSPSNGDHKAVLYTTSLRGVRKTFDDCNAVRSVIQGLGFAFSERDVSMDRGFRDELKLLLAPLKKVEDETLVKPPCLFIKGRYIGGSEKVLKIHEGGGLVELLQGLPRAEAGVVCYGCGDARFMPCCRCNGSCKLVMVVDQVDDHIGDDYQSNCKNGDYICDRNSKKTVVTRCPECNENGLVLCPICS